MVWLLSVALQKEKEELVVASTLASLSAVDHRRHRHLIL